MPLRTHRITGHVEYLTPSGWLSRETSTSSSAPQAAAPITSDDLSRVEGTMGFEYAGSTYLKGSVYNGLPRDLVGDVLFHVEIRDASGKMTIERDYRETVRWPAQQTSDVIIQTDFAWEDDSALEWRLEPAPPK